LKSPLETLVAPITSAISSESLVRAQYSGLPPLMSQTSLAPASRHMDSTASSVTGSTFEPGSLKAVLALTATVEPFPTKRDMPPIFSIAFTAAVKGSGSTADARSGSSAAQPGEGESMPVSTELPSPADAPAAALVLRNQRLVQWVVM
jgi:hypothetical protein